MYSYVSAIVKEKEKYSRWHPVYIFNVPLKTLFSRYRKIYATLTNPFISGDIGFDLENIRISHSQSLLTFGEFLIENGNQALVHMNGVPTIKTRLLKYADAVHAGYKIKPVHPTINVDVSLPKSETPWAHLSRHDTNFETFYKNCLVSVNGFFHLTDFDVNGLYIVDGMKSAMIARQNTVGIYSFREIGEIEIIPIKTSMISRQLESIPLSQRAYIDIGQSVEGKIPAIVIGGYFHLLDEKLYHMVNDKVMCLEFANYRFLDRYYESLRYIDLSSLPIQKYQRNETQISTENLFSDEVIRAYLTLSQSFIVMLNAEDVFIEKVGLSLPKMPGMMVSGVKPNLPLIGGYGRMIDYWYVPEDRKFSITCADDRVDSHVFDTTIPENLVSVTDHRIPTRESRKSFLQFLRIGIDLEV